VTTARGDRTEPLESTDGEAYDGLMRKGWALTVMATMAVVAASLVVSAPASAVASGSHSNGQSAAKAKHPRHCRRAHKAPCSGTQSTQSVTGTRGNLTVTFTATQNGSAVTFDVASSDTQAYGALGPEILTFGNGASEGFATPEYCLADPMAETNDQQVAYSYNKAGTYTASVTVGANCTPDQLTLSLPLNIG
jgi:hypothetical protein